MSKLFATSLFLVLPLTLPADAPPNFLLINIDDLGYADIGPFGSTINRTPQLTRLAREGRKLTCFYAAPVCSPSRASLMTGCYPKRVGIPRVLFPAGETGISAEERTLPELLKERGYATGCVGKWHLGDQAAFLPTRHGFDFYFGIPYSNDMGPAEEGARSDFGAPIPRNNRTKHPPLPLLRNETLVERVDGKAQTTLVERYTDEAVAFLRTHRDGPFFLYLPHSAVHFPLYPGDAIRGRSPHGLYSDWIEEVDASVGRLLDTLAELKLDERTLVVFTSDNGGTRQRANNAPLRGWKGTTFEGGMRVPTIARWPGRIPAGTSTDEVASMMDLLPTFVELAGGAVPEDRPIDGRNIWPLLAGQPGAKSPYEFFYYFGGENLRAIREGRWKLDLESGRLYDLAEDIAESKDVSEKRPEIAERLKAIAAQMGTRLGDGSAGPECRLPGRVEEARPIIAGDGTVEAHFRPR